MQLKQFDQICGYFLLMTVQSSSSLEQWWCIPWVVFVTFRCFTSLDIWTRRQEDYPLSSLCWKCVANIFSKTISAFSYAKVQRSVCQTNIFLLGFNETSLDFFHNIMPWLMLWHSREFLKLTGYLATPMDLMPPKNWQLREFLMGPWIHIDHLGHIPHCVAECFIF